MCVVESLLVFAVAAFYFAVVARCVGANQLVPDPEACGGHALTGDDETTARAVNGVFLRVLKTAQ